VREDEIALPGKFAHHVLLHRVEGTVFQQKRLHHVGVPRPAQVKHLMQGETVHPRLQEKPYEVWYLLYVCRRHRSQKRQVKLRMVPPERGNIRDQGLGVHAPEVPERFAVEGVDGDGDLIEARPLQARKVVILQQRAVRLQGEGVRRLGAS
jgi:hypothetical protein